MIPKRKRNVKLENDLKYNVFTESELDINYVEECKPTQIISGMEAEEEKETHLKSIITEGIGKIPTPIVIKTKELKLKEFKRSDLAIVYDGDCDNKIILDYEDHRFLKTNNFSASQLNLLLEVEDLKRYQEDCDQIIDPILANYVENRRVKVNKLDTDDDHYVCFRKRLNKPSKKARRTETGVQDKIKRLWTEINATQKLYTLHLRRCILEKELLDTNDALIDLAKSSSMIRKKMLRTIFRRRKFNREVPIYKKFENIEDFCGNASKLKEIRSMMDRLNYEFNTVELEREVKALDEYVKGKL